MENNAHAETKENRLRRFQSGPPCEVVSTLLNSIATFFNNEIAITTQGNNYQSSLLFLGVHSVALTISEAFFNKSGSDGYKLFLAKFVDGNTPDTKFSTIAQSIHDWRNVIAHQWIGSIGHSIAYDYNMSSGWEQRDSILFINPKVYLEYYLKAFGSGGKIWDWEIMLTEEEKERSKNKLIAKYISAD